MFDDTKHDRIDGKFGIYCVEDFLIEVEDAGACFFYYNSNDQYYSLWVHVWKEQQHWEFYDDTTATMLKDYSSFEEFLADPFFEGKTFPEIFDDLIFFDGISENRYHHRLLWLEEDSK